MPFRGLPPNLLVPPGKVKGELVQTPLKTYVTLGPALGNSQSTFPFFFFLSKIVHFLIEIEMAKGAFVPAPRTRPRMRRPLHRHLQRRDSCTG